MSVVASAPPVVPTTTDPLPLLQQMSEETDLDPAVRAMCARLATAVTAARRGVRPPTVPMVPVRPSTARSPLEALLTNALEVVVFLPILFTWFELARALSASSEASAAGEGGRPFISLWQDGFGGRATSFSTVALIVALLVGTVVLLAVARSVVIGRGERVRQVQVDRLELVIYQARLELADAQDLLDASAGTAGVIDAVGRLDRAAAALTDAVGSSVTAFQASAAAVDVVRRRTDELSGSVDSAARDLAATAASAAAVAALLADRESLDERLVTVIDQWEASLATLAAAVAQSRIVDESAQALLASAGGVLSRAESIDEAAAAREERDRVQAEVMREAVAAMLAAASQLERSMAGVQEAAVYFRGVAADVAHTRRTVRRLIDGDGTVDPTAGEPADAPLS